MSSLKNKNVLVAGGATGIGWACAASFAEAGCHVAVAGRRQEKLAAACESYQGEGEVRYHPVDVSDRESVAQLVHWFGESVGPVDILVNAAGINIKNRTMAAMDAAQWDQVMAVNATGAYNLMAAVLPQMRSREQGTIINISSISGKRAIELGGIAYCASKFAMTALGTAVGQEEAPHGIRVTNVYPGEVDTPILEQRPTPVSEEHRKRILVPQDVADLVLSICALPARAHVPEIVIKPRLQAYF